MVGKGSLDFILSASEPLEASEYGGSVVRFAFEMTFLTAV